jgi:hypothetical protein
MMEHDWITKKGTNCYTIAELAFLEDIFKIDDKDFNEAFT